MSRPIYPDYIGNYKGKLLQPILKHTKVRRPMSEHVIQLRNNAEVLRGKEDYEAFGRNILRLELRNKFKDRLEGSEQ